MTEPLASSRTLLFTITTSIALVCWRIAVVPHGSIWKDWVIIVALVAVIAAWKPRTRVLSTTIVAASTYMLTLYVHGQWAHLTETLGLWR